MNLKTLISNLELYFLAKSLPYDDEDVHAIASLISENNYIHIHDIYEVEMLHYLIDMFEVLEEYMECAKIRDAILDLKKLEKNQ